MTRAERVLELLQCKALSLWGRNPSATEPTSNKYRKRHLRILDSRGADFHLHAIASEHDFRSQGCGRSRKSIAHLKRAFYLKIRPERVRRSNGASGISAVRWRDETETELRRAKQKKMASRRIG
jgi:hypothetical protein